MALKDLLVLTGAGTDAAQGYAAWLSNVCGASLTAAVPVVEPSMPAYVMTELPTDLLSRIQQEAEAEARKTLQNFSTLAQQAGTTFETISFRAVSGRVGDTVSYLARCFDATILPQAQSSGAEASEVIEAVLFGSGRPLIIVPYIPVRKALGTVLVAWDGGAPAARAVADALPLLTLARHVQIVTVSSRENEPLSLSGTNLARHLARHGINAELRRISSEDVDVANMLLSHAADAEADLMVMGGYGHTRLREFVLGGATREILRSMTIPVMMSH